MFSSNFEHSGLSDSIINEMFGGYISQRNQCFQGKTICMPFWFWL